MVTIIKVKRKINEDPADCLIIECKKKENRLGLNKTNFKICWNCKNGGSLKTKENKLNDQTYFFYCLLLE